MSMPPMPLGTLSPSPSLGLGSRAVPLIVVIAVIVAVMGTVMTAVGYETSQRKLWLCCVLELPALSAAITSTL